MAVFPLVPPTFESTDSLTWAPGTRKLRAAACGSSDGISSPESGGLSPVCGGGLSCPKAGAGTTLPVAGWVLSLDCCPLPPCAQPTPSANARNIAVQMHCHFFIACSSRDDNRVAWFKGDILRRCIALHCLLVIECHFLLFTIFAAQHINALGIGKLCESRCSQCLQHRHAGQQGNGS